MPTSSHGSICKGFAKNSPHLRSKVRLGPKSSGFCIRLLWGSIVYIGKSFSGGGQRQDRARSIKMSLGVLEYIVVEGSEGPVPVISLPSTLGAKALGSLGGLLASCFNI